MRVCYAIFFAAALLACQEPQSPAFMGPEVDALRARHGDFAEALAAKQATATAEFYDRGSAIYEPLIVLGRPHVSMELTNESLFADPNGSIQFLHTEFETSGTLAVSRGECIVTRTDPRSGHAAQMRGYCMTSWRRGEDDQWRVAWESRNVAPSNAHSEDVSR